MEYGYTLVTMDDPVVPGEQLFYVFTDNAKGRRFAAHVGGDWLDVFDGESVEESDWA